ncbi:MAG: carboxypeptidase regulatory-like domain-containing protein [Clostridia bacterium]|nr:carboxypeptidase regulatory-like domain-containing protein [Clostridia bacterium]
MKQGIGLMLLCLMLLITVGYAEQRQYGDYIYVPAIGSVTSTDAIHLSVEGIGYSETGEPETKESLSGAEFGVYVVSAGGEVRPWANPLYPTEQMKIRTGASGASFTLPSGVEFYLIQETTQSGYQFDAEAMIPVDSHDMVIRNTMPAMISVETRDSQNVPLVGLRLRLTESDGTILEAETDEYGRARFLSDTGITGIVEEISLPEDVHPAKAGMVNGEAAELPLQVTCAPGTCVFLSFEHPAIGYVQLNTVLSFLDDLGETVTEPLAGIEMQIESQPPRQLLSDEEGFAETTLLEGTYSVSFSAQDPSLVLPFTQASLIIESGGVTTVPVEVMQDAGRIQMEADFHGHEASGSLSVISEADGTTVSETEMSPDGHLISQSLASGLYWVRLFAGDGNRIDEIYSEQIVEQNEDAVLVEVQPGRVSLLNADIAVPEKQAYTLAMQTLSEDGETLIQPLVLSGDAVVHGESDGEQIKLTVENGMAALESFTGRYTMELDPAAAENAGVRTLSESFELPSGDGTVLFPVMQGRILLHAADTTGSPAVEGVYEITDAAGDVFTLSTDENGLAISPLLAEGPAVIENLELPVNCDASAAVHVEIGTGELSLAEIEHPRKGTVTLTAVRQSVENGRLIRTPLDEVGIQLNAVSGILDDDMIICHTDETGRVRIFLSSGVYEAALIAEELDSGETAGEPVVFTVANETDIEAELCIYAPDGGVEVRVQGDPDTRLLTQMQFELRNDELTVPLRLKDGAFTAYGLPAGTYVLAETLAPAGYSIMKQREITVKGGNITDAEVPLEEYATVTVTKYGLTFDESLKNYLVPLSGGYGVFVREGDTYVPYPNQAEQAVVYSNVSAESGLPVRVQLPAEDAGTLYYLMELEGNAGFALDSEIHEIEAYPGNSYDMICSVSSDRGFYQLAMTDSETGEAVLGAAFELADADGKVLDTFYVTENYRNEMAIPVGDYSLRQISAAPGYMLDDTAVSFHVNPYLTMGGQVSEISFSAVRIPPADWGETLFENVSTAESQGMTFVTADAAQWTAAYDLIVPQLTIRLHTDEGNAAGIQSLSVSRIVEGQIPALVRVEYEADTCGWQGSQSRVYASEDMPLILRMPEQERITAVRLTYMDAESGLEDIHNGFMPGDVTVQISGYGDNPVPVEVEASISGTVRYLTEKDASAQSLQIESSVKTALNAGPSGMAAPAAMGSDGHISGFVFYDAHADGILRPDSKRLAGAEVQLCDLNGNVIERNETDEAGRYDFTDLPAGTYILEFDSPYVYTRGQGYSEYLCSRVSATGISEPVVLDGAHTDICLMAGYVRPAQIRGSVIEQTLLDVFEPMEGRVVEFWSEGEEDPQLVATDSDGVYVCRNLLPGVYEIRLELPEGSLSRKSENGALTEKVVVEEGEILEAEPFELIRAAHISGAVRVDEDGDGRINAASAGVASIHVELSELSADGHMETVAGTETDLSGAYAFTDIYPGEYVLSYELNGDWVFTRYGADSAVYGSVSERGSTRPFKLACSDAPVFNVGVTEPSELSVMVFEDLRMDGVRQANEGGVSGVQISLIRMENGQEAEVLPAYTDETGMVIFSRVSPGEYVLAYRMPGIWRTTVFPSGMMDAASFVPQSTEPDGRSSVFAIRMGTSLGLYIGAVQTGSIGGTAFYDDNADSALSSGEVPAAGIKAELLDAQEAVLKETLTDEEGSYCFDGIPAGRYMVRFTAHDGECFSGNERTAARSSAVRSDTNVSTTRIIPLESGRNVTAANAGIVRLSRITGQIYIDRNADRAMNADEQPMEGASIALTSESGRTIVAETLTGPDGTFTFSSVYPGQYKLRIDAGESYVYAGDTAGCPLTVESHSGSWYYTAGFTMLGNSAAEGLQYGFLQQGVIRGQVWEDLDYDGLTGTDSGLRYVTLTLFDSTGAKNATVRTDADGHFEFAKLMPGNYSLEITLESGYVFTVSDQDSIAPRVDSNTCTISLGYLDMGQVREDIRIGALKPASLSGYVWYDEDGDGRRQTDSQLMAGIPITLNIISGADAGLSKAAETDAQGHYRFDMVMPGEAVLTAELPENYAFTRNVSGLKRISIMPETDANTADSNPISVSAGQNLPDLDIGIVGIGVIDGRIWMDKQYDGRMTDEDEPLEGAEIRLIDAATGAAVRSVISGSDGSYSLERVRMGEYRLHFALPEHMIFTRSGDGVIEMSDLSEAETENLTLPMGGQIHNQNAGAIYPASLSGMILDEDNGDGYPSVMVTLMEGGMAVAGTETDKDGRYAFDLIRPGTYRLRYALPEHTLFALSTPLRLADADDVEGETDAFTAEIGQTIEVAPLQVVRGAAVSGLTWSDANVNGKIDTGEAALAGVQVQLLDAETGTPVTEMQTGEDGSYAFNQIRRGSYILSVELPGGQLFTDLGSEAGASCISPTENNEGESERFVLSSGEKREMNVGAILPGTIGDTVWLDLNGNGLQDYKEPLVSDVPILLLIVGPDGEEEEAAVLFSDEYGYYHFTGLRPGRYRIRVEDDRPLTLHFGEPLQMIDSDVDPESRKSDVFLLQSGERKLDVDIGILPE